MRGSTGQARKDAQRLVDAVRECLGLAPLYSNPYRTDAERFAREPSAGWTGRDGNGNRISRERLGPDTNPGGRQ